MRILAGLCLTLVLVVGPNVAQAATLLSTTGHALNDGNGPSGGVWQGSQNYVGALLGDTLDADVEFAVFAPGANFQNFLDENGILFVDPAPGEYTYAYQIWSLAAGTTSISQFTVGLQSDEALGATGVTFIPKATPHGAYAPAPTVDPTSTGGGPGVSSSSAWGGWGVALSPGEASAILYYSSPQVPELGLSTLNAGLAGEFIADSLPNPSAAVPEPTTLALGILAGLSLIARRRL